MIRFNATNIENSAIHIVADQLIPYLEYDPDAEFRVLNEDKAQEKYRVLYNSVFIPYCIESREHFSCHHYDAPMDSWCGEQACLSMIYAINQKAWWLLYYYAIKEAVEARIKVSKDKIRKIAQGATSSVLDYDTSIEDAIHAFVSEELNLERDAESLIVDDVTQTIKRYREVESSPMIYR